MSSQFSRRMRRSRVLARWRAWLRSGAAASALLASFTGCRSDSTFAWLGRETMSPAVSHEHANSLAWRSRGETPWTVARVDPDAQPVRIPSTADSPSEVRLAGYQPTELPAARADDVGNSPDAKTNPDDPAPKAAVPQVTVPEVVTGSRPMADPASRPVPRSARTSRHRPCRKHVPRSPWPTG